MSKTLALFDFDNTLTTEDSFWAFLKFAKTRSEIAKAALLLAPKLALYKLGIVKNDEAKIAVIRKLFSGDKRSRIDDLGIEFSKRIIPNILNGTAVHKLQWHKQQNHDVVVVSASLDWYLKPWCKTMQVECICTRIINHKNGLIGRNYNGENIHGQKKVEAIISKYSLAEYDAIYAYGDSISGDGPMLELANHAFFRKFN